MTTPQDLVSHLLRRNARDGALLVELWDALQSAPPLDPPPVIEPPPSRPPPWPRFDVFTLREMETERTVPWKSGDSADSLLLLPPGPHNELGLRIEASTRSGLHTPSGSGHIRGVLVHGCELRSGKPMPDGDGTRWLARVFGVNAWTVRESWFHDSNHKNEGHGFYANVTGPLTIRSSLFENLGGNAIQLVWNEGKREHEGPHTEGGLILLDNIAIRNVSWNPARGSFAIAIYGGYQEKHDIVLRDLDLDLEWSEEQTRSGHQCFSAGGINCRGYSEDEYDIGAVTIENCRISMKQPFQPLMQLGSCRSLVVTGCELIGGKVDIDPDYDMHRPCESIVWEGNTGDALVRHKDGLFRHATENWSV